MYDPNSTLESIDKKFSIMIIEYDLIFMIYALLYVNMFIIMRIIKIFRLKFTISAYLFKISLCNRNKQTIRLTPFYNSNAKQFAWIIWAYLKLENYRGRKMRSRKIWGHENFSYWIVLAYM